MRALILTVLFGAALMAGALEAPAQSAGTGPLLGASRQHGRGHQHDGSQGQGHLETQRCAEQFDAVVRQGQGFGMAFAADQHGYPGPLHILELREALGLTPQQERRARSLMEAMFAESRPQGAALLLAEARLRALFESKTATEPSLRALVAEIERLRGELRLVHLLSHLSGRDLLSEEQRGIYHSRRWASSPKGR